MTTTYRPVPGKLTVDPQNRIVTVKRYGTDASGEFVEVQLAGNYGAHVRLPISCIRPLAETEQTEAAHVTDAKRRWGARHGGADEKTGHQVEAHHRRDTS